MGQRESCASGSGPKKSPNRNANAFLFMDFAKLFLGGTLDELEVSRLPTSWDELLDWTDDAENMSRSSGATDPLRVVKIEPLIQGKPCSVDSIPSLPPIEQATFFAASVIIKFELQDIRNAPVTTHLLSVRDFAKYYTLVRRLSDLLALERLQCSKSEAATTERLTECVICCDEASNSILPCSHRICESCERRWVRKQLVCPFCSTRFQSAEEIRNSAWNLPEFSAEELHRDLVDAYIQIEKFWENCNTKNSVVESNTALSYVSVGRRIKVTTDDDELLVSKA